MHSLRQNVFPFFKLYIRLQLRKTTDSVCSCKCRIILIRLVRTWSCKYKQRDKGCQEIWSCKYPSTWSLWRQNVLAFLHINHNELQQAFVSICVRINKCRIMDSIRCSCKYACNIVGVNKKIFLMNSTCQFIHFNYLSWRHISIQTILRVYISVMQSISVILRVNTHAISWI